jgi:hypothetical protein
MSRPKAGVSLVGSAPRPAASQDLQAIQEIADRLDGKCAQVSGDDVGRCRTNRA